MINEEYILNKISAGGGRNLSSFSRFPEYLQIETTNDCTARCVMCGINEWKKKISGKFMSDSLFFKIANNGDKGRWQHCFVLYDQCRVYKLGNLNETSIKENWQNNQIRESFKEIHIKSGRDGVEFCKNCIAWIN